MSTLWEWNSSAFPQLCNQDFCGFEASISQFFWQYET
ncbi:hypothetical protein CsSME_00050271 [Camellia sinensis var. sinensis]